MLPDLFAVKGNITSWFIGGARDFKLVEFTSGAV